jgi:hypothetical protein
MLFAIPVGNTCHQKTVYDRKKVSSPPDHPQQQPQG